VTLHATTLTVTMPHTMPAANTMFIGNKPKNPPWNSTELKESVELYLNSPFGHSWPVLGRPLPLHLLRFVKDIFKVWLIATRYSP